jgi:hypothetical protein
MIGVLSVYGLQFSVYRSQVLGSTFRLLASQFLYPHSPPPIPHPFPIRYPLFSRSDGLLSKAKG